MFFSETPSIDSGTAAVTSEVSKEFEDVQEIPLPKGAAPTSTKKHESDNSAKTKFVKSTTQ